MIPYFLRKSSYVNLPIPHILWAIVPTLNILRIVYLVSTARVVFGGGQTSVNRRVIARLSASPHVHGIATSVLVHVRFT